MIYKAWKVQELPLIYKGFYSETENATALYYLVLFAVISQSERFDLKGTRITQGVL